MKITVVSQVYNQNPAYLRQSIESVLNQTFRNLELLLLDNGCTDGSSEILSEYAAADPRIRLLRYCSNVPGPRWLFALRDHAVGDYFSLIDSDDWWEPDYLERLAALAESEKADIVCTGTQMHEEGTGRMPQRKMLRRLVLERAQYPTYFPLWLTFISPCWGKLVQRSLIGMQDADAQFLYPLFENDIHISLDWLSCCERLCIDDSLLHHCRIRQKSLVHTFHPEMMAGGASICHTLYSFLLSFGQVSLPNRLYIERFYVLRMGRDVVGSVRASSLTPEEQLFQLQKMVELPETQQLLPNHTPTVQLMKQKILLAVFEIIEQLGEGNAALWYILDTLSADNLFLHGIRDIGFLRRFQKLYLLLWEGRYDEALAEMGTCLDRGEGDNGTFLDLCLALSAAEKKFPLFLKADANRKNYRDCPELSPSVISIEMEK